MQQFIEVRPRDPLIIRDGRPFGAQSGHHMHSLDWPYPSVLAGAFRSLAGKLTDLGPDGFDEALMNEVLEIEVAGPLPKNNGQLYFPAPLDLAAEKKDGQLKTHALRPMALHESEGMDLPSESLLPTALAEEVDDFKPESIPDFFSCNRMVDWLLNGHGDGFTIPRTHEEWGKDYLKFPPQEDRTHVKILPDTYASDEGMLFSTTGLCLDGMSLNSPTTLSARIGADDKWLQQFQGMEVLNTLGGERRLAHWSEENDASLWACPENIVSYDTRHVRMVLASPAIFQRGWLPGWLGDDLTGSPPGSDSVLKLTGACSARWMPISGWSYKDRGPKKIRRLVPAGSVYFFELKEGQFNELASSCWLQSVCDDAQERRDGFGLALWGTWNFHNQ